MIDMRGADVAPRSEETEEVSESYRPVRNDRFRELLDEEFQRSYRFEALGNIFNDVKDFFRKVVTRDEEGELEFSDSVQREKR
ncbi:MAG: hypothetical protein AAF581_16625 [Planctomycetota bacterium]